MNDNNPPHGSSRRKTIKKIAALGAAAVCAPLIIINSKKIAQKKAAQRIVIRTSGGEWHYAATELLFKPFQEKFGIEMVGIPSNAEPIAEIRSMVDTGNYNWHMACLGNRAIPILSQQNYLEKHGLEHDPIVSTIMPQFMSPYSVGMNVYSTVLTYRTDVFQKRPPQNWKDFWDAENFPGRRGLRKVPFDTIEQALLADGVAPSAVYPCDLDRAFRSLDRIKPHISVWWQSTPEAEHLLKVREVDVMPVFLTAALGAIKSGAPVAFSWDQHVYGYDNWTILKGTPNADACREFIRFATDPKRQALLAPHGISPTQPSAFDYIKKEHAKFLAVYPENFSKGIPSSALYWLDNYGSIVERYNRWFLN
ncbi:MAG: putative spermidine/putrescine transport system substrate-binding protein [Glomeribacter sp. 1016415]|uniref:FAD/FMN-containing dehydrogenase n=1 Tax=Mycoavidus cysteinexigens TaxID=1553431 RepID=A0A2Z6ETT3_9BURK|nr:ABC transporter substrate-binding protein [Mycoavidus cysteinexigens]MCX8565488.1 putative spermidine/putrescine transport system substrate-binding protein [Glomeribacter sp. 1016415]BBE08853.1 FAD/FMN-containing dehydrogenase [Mycoavidus cysteinexigens]GAM52430.1 ABC transporter, periplasmic spermidine putrescine-binding protein PotD [bacterium endosymbiont of Mortierella elongata FMR23-6]GLR02212.1 dehydrogenase [Mycoavidus cysteinexigens]